MSGVALGALVIGGAVGGGAALLGSGAKKRGDSIGGAGALTPEEQQSLRLSSENEAILSQILRFQQGVGERPSGFLSPSQQFAQQGDLQRALIEKVTRGVQDPDAVFQSTLNPQLQIAEDFINRRFQQKGLLRSGLPIESLGRAGVELAIGEANARLNFRNQALQQGFQLQGGIQGVGQQNIVNLAGLTARGQNFSQTGINRAATAQIRGIESDLAQDAATRAGIQTLIGSGIGAAGSLGSGALIGRGGLNTTQRGFTQDIIPGFR